MTDSAIDSARTSSTIETMRASGKTDEEIAAAVLFPDGGSGENLAHDIIITNLLMEMGEFFCLGYKSDEENYNKAFFGLALNLQHYVDHPEAVEFNNLVANAKTVNDVWTFFLEKNGLSDEVLEKMASYDKTFFKNLLSMEISQCQGFGINREEVLRKEE